MKKLLLFFIALVAFAFLAGGDLYEIADKFDGDYIAYTTEGDGVPVFASDGRTVYAGDYDKNVDLVAETIVLKEKLSEKEILKRLNSLYHFHGDIDGVTIIYGFSPRLKHVTLINKKPVNFQITISGEIATVSSPINVGSY